MAVMTDIGSSSNHLVERFRLVQPAGLPSSSLCCTTRRKSTATEALLSVLLITGEKICTALGVGTPATDAEVGSIVTNEARIHIFIGGPSRSGTCGAWSCVAGHRLTTETP
jgi:hypothetical protein